MDPIHAGNNLSNDHLKSLNPQEQIEYFKRKLEESQTEFQEFQESSRELELEYETQIQQLEKKNASSLLQIDQLQEENDQLRSRYNSYANDTQHKLNEYQQQISELTSLNDRLTTYIRELEQNNDDLERAQRALAASLEDFEAQLNQQIERNVLLENEVSEKEELEVIVQRLKEEARDLRHELVANKVASESTRKKQLMIEDHLSTARTDASLVQLNSLRQDSLVDREGQLDKSNSLASPVRAANHRTKESPQINSDLRNSSSNGDSKNNTPRFSFSSPFSYGGRASFSVATDSKSQQTSAPSSPTLPAMVMSPSSRVSALNIVNDLLRKVGALESRLASPKKSPLSLSK